MPSALSIIQLDLFVYFCLLFFVMIKNKKEKKRGNGLKEKEIK